MKDIQPLNKNVSTESSSLEDAISEMMEREEFVCTGNACGANACAVHDLG